MNIFDDFLLGLCLCFFPNDMRFNKKQLSSFDEKHVMKFKAMVRSSIQPWKIIERQTVLY